MGEAITPTISGNFGRTLTDLRSVMCLIILEIRGRETGPLLACSREDGN